MQLTKSLLSERKELYQTFHVRSSVSTSCIKLVVVSNKLLQTHHVLISVKLHPQGLVEILLELARIWEFDQPFVANAKYYSFIIMSNSVDIV